MKDIQKTIHLSKAVSELTQGFELNIPVGATIIEPCVGEGDLLGLFPSHNWETYDIRDEANPRDTLKNPPNYKGKYVVANPPYLARNKASDKSLYDQSGYDDLYKIFISTILDSEGGIIIVPVNFLADERSGGIRTLFFNRFTVLHINFFTCPMFETTTYSVCTIFFSKKNTISAQKQVAPLTILPENNKVFVDLDPEFGYRIGGRFYNLLSTSENIFGRVVSEDDPSSTNIYLASLDTRSEKIRLVSDHPVYVGKPTDRVKATLTCRIALSKDQEREIVKEFNKILNEFREENHNLILTNYRDHNRKRMGFDEAYRLASHVAKKLNYY